jgi:protein-S-isoprenylcysteine O-methyltransferase Ste14
MQYFGSIVGLAWIIFLLVWFISAFSAKRSLQRSWWRNSWVRIIIAIGIYLLFREQLQQWLGAGYVSPTTPLLAAIGAFLTVIGIALAIWARFYIGRNWGMPMSLKENRKLVTSGPYSYIRHPIYTGIMLAMIGSALLIGPWLLVVFIIYFLYFLFSATSEEKTLTKEFPDTYPAYKARTKMLIPFVL